MPAMLAAILGLFLLIFALSRLKSRKFVSAALNSSMAFVLISSSFTLFLLAMNLHSYQRLNHEQAIAEIRFSKVAPQRFQAELRLADADNYSNYDIMGDEWQLDARILKWKPPATLLGIDARYRLERLSGRYRVIEQERSQARSVYALSEDQGMDLWSLIGRLREYLPWMDAYYGSATYLPMKNGAHFEIRVTQSGLLARPLNDEGHMAVREWY